MPGCHKQILLLVALWIPYSVTNLLIFPIFGYAYLVLCILLNEVRPKRLIKREDKIYIDKSIPNGFNAYTQGIVNQFIAIPDNKLRTDELFNAAICHEYGHIKTGAALVTAVYYLVCHTVITILVTNQVGIIGIIISSTCIVMINYLRHVLLEIVADNYCVSKGYKNSMKKLISLFRKTITNKIRARLIGKK